MKFLAITTDTECLDACARLMAAAFPQAGHLTSAYLGWLYRDNPAGAVLGFNAWEDGTLVGHYAAIPVNLSLAGKSVRGILALNTATHPDHRNTVMAYTLANKTFKQASQEGFSCVYAVANAASTPLCEQALKFQNVGQLRAGVGFGPIKANWELAQQQSRFYLQWHGDTAAWRAANPENATCMGAAGDGLYSIWADTFIPAVKAYGLMPVSGQVSASSRRHPLRPTVYLGLHPPKSLRAPLHWPIPERLKPSPLNFIYRPLSAAAPQSLNLDEVWLGFHDFDPF